MYTILIFTALFNFNHKGNECLHIWFLQRFAKNVFEKQIIDRAKTRKIHIEVKGT